MVRRAQAEQHQSLAAIRSKAWPTVSMPRARLFDGHVEGFLERHHEFNEVEAVRVEVLGEACLLGDLLLRNLEHLDRTLLELLERCVAVHCFSFVDRDRGSLGRMRVLLAP